MYANTRPFNPGQFSEARVRARAQLHTVTEVEVVGEFGEGSSSQPKEEPEEEVEEEDEAEVVGGVEDPGGSYINQTRPGVRAVPPATRGGVENDNK